MMVPASPTTHTLVAEVPHTSRRVRTVGLLIGTQRAAGGGAVAFAVKVTESAPIVAVSDWSPAAAPSVHAAWARPSAPSAPCAGLTEPPPLATLHVTVPVGTAFP